MASENTKIIVQEVNSTTPLGSGASSDVVYVPGFAINEAASRNVPQLCVSVAEFEEFFGKVPYQFTADQKLSDGRIIARKGDYDRSYIYAKELLNAGLPVLYENITSDAAGVEDVGVFVSGDNASGVADKKTNERSTFKRVDGKSNTYEFVFGGTVSADGEERTLWAQFTLDSGVLSTTYGEVSLVVKNDTGLFTAESANDKVTIVSENAVNKFNIVGNKISWDTSNNITEADLDKTVFKAQLQLPVTAEMKDIPVAIGLHVVTGDIDSESPYVIIQPEKLTYLYSQFEDRMQNLCDRSEYTVKYITSGGYPALVFGSSTSTALDIAKFMLNTAAVRNDAVALIDHENDGGKDLSPKSGNSIYSKCNTYFKSASNPEFGAMFTPWGEYRIITNTIPNQILPASFGYLLCLANAIKTSPNWLAMAGVTRGVVPNLVRLATAKTLTNVIAEDYQPKVGTDNVISLNAITNIKPYGLTIWGNRTLLPVDYKGTVATNFLNTRNMISDVKKTAYNTAKSLMFEQDSDTLWLRFKSGISPLLEQLKNGYGISDYKIIRGTTRYLGGQLNRGELAAVIRLFPVNAVEYFEITVHIADQDVAVS